MSKSIHEKAGASEDGHRIESIIFSATLPNHPHVARMSDDYFGPQRANCRMAQKRLAAQSQKKQNPSSLAPPFCILETKVATALHFVVTFAAVCATESMA